MHFVEKWQNKIIIGLLFIVCAAMFYANLLFARQNQAGVDFLIRWLPARMTLFEGLDSPYSDEATAAVENFQYGHPAQGDEVEGLFLYPYYTIFLMLPFTLVKDYTIARALWMTALELSHIVIILLSMRMLRFQPKGVPFLLLLVLALVSTYFIQPIIDGNPASLTALLIVLCLYFLEREQDVPAGIFLALATFKPQMTILFWVLVWWWAFSHKRWAVLYSSLAGVALLMGLSFAFQPSWLGEFIGQLRQYSSIASPNTPQTILQGFLPQASRWIAPVLSIVSVGILSFTWLRVYRKDFRVFLWTVCVTFAVLPLSGIVFGNRNLVALLPAVVLIVAAAFQSRPRLGWLWNLLLLMFVCLSWALMMVPADVQVWYAFFSFKNYLIVAAVFALGLFMVQGFVNKKVVPVKEGIADEKKPSL